MQAVAISELRRRLSAILRLFPADDAVVFTGDVTVGNNNVMNVSSFDGLEVGMAITDSAGNFPPGTTIASLNVPATQLILSNVSGGTTVGDTFTATLSPATAQVHLFKAPFAGGTDPSPAAFTEADFDTYAAKPVGTPIGPYTNPDGSAEVDFGDFGWVLTATPVTANTIYGYWVDYVYPRSGVTRVVSFWETLPTPIVMNAIADAVVLSIPVTLPDPSSATQP